MIGKELVALIRKFHLEKYQINPADTSERSISFRLNLNDPNRKYRWLNYTLSDLNNHEDDPKEYDYDGDGFFGEEVIDAFRFEVDDSDNDTGADELSIDEAYELLKYADNPTNDGENLIKYIEDNHLGKHIVYIDDINERIHFVKRVIVEDLYRYSSTENDHSIILENESYDDYLDTVKESDTIGGIIRNLYSENGVIFMSDEATESYKKELDDKIKSYNKEVSK